MRKHTIIPALTLVLLCAFSALAADVSGKWYGLMEMGSGRAMEQTFTFKMEEGKLTGTVKTQSGERQISEGKINGDEISFVTTIEGGRNKMKMLYKGKISGNEIKFQHGMEGGQQREFTVKRIDP